jgi:tRNA threonylcarbamoyladenosine biosynthesis protein TsaE
MTRAGFVVQTNAPEETAALGECVGLEASAGLVLGLRGELGAGKTVFVRGLAAGYLGSEKVSVTSPTYVLEHIYRSGKGAVYHLDLYRLSGGAADFEGAGLADCLRASDGLVCIEWAERIEEILPADRLEVEFDHLGPEKRLVHLLATGTDSAKVVDLLISQVGTPERLRAFLARKTAPGTNLDASSRH